MDVVVPESVGLSTARLGRLSAVIAARVAAGHVPGAVALVARRGRVAYFESFGKRDPGAADGMGKDAIFRIYSMTKPIVSVAAMMLWEEGKFLLSDAVGKYLPEFGHTVMTVQDLLRHTSGLTYEFRGTGPVQKAYTEAKVFRRNQTNAEQSVTLAGLPLASPPGTRWEYSRSTDVLGRLVEVLSGRTLGGFLGERIFAPLGMKDTGFHVPPAALGRLAGAFAKDPDTGADVVVLDVTQPAMFESGGGGLVSTTADYAQFLQMMLSGGVLHGERLLGPMTVALMTADHLGSIPGDGDLLNPGYGFGLGFAVRMHAGISVMPGRVGQYFWGGAAGTTFWVDPAEELYAVMMIQGPGQREFYRVLFRDMVYASLVD